jgi:hypothetical protein
VLHSSDIVQDNKYTPARSGGKKVLRQRPTLPGINPSTISAGGLNGRVRDGNGWSPSAIATGMHLQNRTVKGQVLDRLVPVSSMHCCTYTPGLSTWWSSRGLTKLGNLILGPVSRLDAFSAYPSQAWLSSRAPGGTTGTPAACPSRSSRTRDRSLQVSCAHDG